MKRSSVFAWISGYMFGGACLGFIVFVLIELCSCHEKRLYTLPELTGHYLHEEKRGPFDKGWYTEMESEHHLFLYDDSTYEEIYETSSDFEAPDYWGRWSIKHDSIFFYQDGELVRENGTYVRGGYVSYTPVEYSGWKTMTVLDVSNRYIRLADDYGETVFTRQ